MKKIMTKVLSVFMAVAMCVGLCATAFADTSKTITNTSPSDTGSITINDLAEGVTASAYQIAKATYDNNGNMLGYEMTVSVPEGGWSIANDGSWTDPTEAQLAALYESVGTASGSATAGSNGTATIEGLPVGSYLVVITGSESVAYGMMIGSVYYMSSDGSWTINSGAITDVKDCELWAKSTTPTVEKTEHHTGGSDTHGESANAGDKITFDITIENIPSYQGDYPVFDVDDTLTGLTVSTDDLNAIKVTYTSTNGTDVRTLVKDTHYTVTQISATEFDVNFVVNGAYTLNDFAGKGTIVIEYQATVVDSEAYENGEAEHDNDVVLTYATTSYINHDNNTNEGHDKDKDYEYTFEMDFYKQNTSNQALANATFGLFTDSACADAYTQNGTAVTATSNDDGKVEFTGLAEGTYYLTETKAPAGYALNQTVYTVKISATYEEDGSIRGWDIIVSADGQTVASATNDSATDLVVINTNLKALPSMGGTGIALCVIAGCIVLGAAVAGVAVYRRKNNAEV